MEISIRGKIGFIDEEDLILFRRHTWRIIKNRVATDVRNLESRRYERVLFHRLVLGLKPGDPFVDHVNGNSLDNRKSNLRISNYSNNGLNRRIINNSGTSKYLGVHWNTTKQRWMAMREINGQKRYFGQFKTEGEAIKAVEEGCKRLGVPRGY